MNDKEKAHCAKLIGDAGGSKDGGDLGAEITRQQADGLGEHEMTRLWNTFSENDDTRVRD